jgi:iron-sulfur cluster repair protein YtfE (RIC family)
MSTTDALHRHHKHCDDLFASAEAAAHGGNWETCADLHRQFRDELLAHFSTEEQVLFPAFETGTGMVGGPTQVMRIEHAQMRELLEQMDSAVAQRARQPYAGAAETLLVLMQQHNMKEENILYPMCDRAVADSVDIAGALCSRVEATCRNRA